MGFVGDTWHAFCCNVNVVQSTSMLDMAASLRIESNFFLFHVFTIDAESSNVLKQANT